MFDIASQYPIYLEHIKEFFKEFLMTCQYCKKYNYELKDK